MNAVEKLKALYEVKEITDAQIAQIEAVLGGAEAPVQRRKRGPNKPKQTQEPTIGEA